MKADIGGSVYRVCGCGHFFHEHDGRRCHAFDLVLTTAGSWATVYCPCTATLPEPQPADHLERRAVREVWLTGPLEDMIRDIFRRGLAEGDPRCEALAARLAEQQRGGR